MSFVSKLATVINTFRGAQANACSPHTSMTKMATLAFRFPELQERMVENLHHRISTGSLTVKDLIKQAMVEKDLWPVAEKYIIRTAGAHLEAVEALAKYLRSDESTELVVNIGSQDHPLYEVSNFYQERQWSRNILISISAVTGSKDLRLRIIKLLEQALPVKQTVEITRQLTDHKINS